MSKICINENCNEKALYGLVNPETGMFEKHHCKIHKENNEKGKPPIWEFRYNDVDKISTNRNVKLLDTKEEFIKKCKESKQHAYLLLECLVCLDVVKTTTINNFVNKYQLRCSCSKKVPWYSRYPEFLEICNNRNTKLLDTEQQFILKTKKDGKNAYLKLECLICSGIVDTTTLDSFVIGSLGCSCNTNFKWSKRPDEFLEICKDRNVILLDSEEEFIEKTKKDGNRVYLNLQCLECNVIVTTTINNFVNNGHFGCSCTKKKSEKCLGEILAEIFPEYKFKKIRPDWIKNKKGNNLELDFYNEELKLAFEYQGIQHEQYVQFFHQGDINNFYKQQEHDRIKKQVCEKIGIKLICISSKYNYTNPLEMCEYILDNL